jgi:hypothetical protein
MLNVQFQSLDLGIEAQDRDTGQRLERSFEGILGESYSRMHMEQGCTECSDKSPWYESSATKNSSRHEMALGIRQILGNSPREEFISRHTRNRHLLQLAMEVRKQSLSYLKEYFGLEMAKRLSFFLVI